MSTRVPLSTLDPQNLTVEVFSNWIAMIKCGSAERQALSQISAGGSVENRTMDNGLWR